ncbi:hypothetical protein K458DRAFT_410279 [Lentithecium fluviatile CBS 122367]|uniref:Uncharacterized protein n=1 Tax=Lentithecium fluviatile CBS 122367 TaxID=1168545 RepID=A0A6G1IFE2_9PLEO|nr:hypothetical protein K458DRAFT_410279 [Lentithecium fluviatile CBS 122367]
MNAFNIKLIEQRQEKDLLRERYHPRHNQNVEAALEVHTALHTMAAHLNRLKAEVAIMEDNIRGLLTNLTSLCTSKSCSTSDSTSVAIDYSHHFQALIVRVQGLATLNAELEHQKRGVCTVKLIASVIQHEPNVNWPQIVDSSESMRRVMKATKEEPKHSRFMAKQSQEMAEDMRKDGRSMKAVFPPLSRLFIDVSNAILSMPFFGEQPWLSKASRVWVWFGLSIPTTALAVLFYVVNSRRMWSKGAKKRSQHKAANEIEMEDNE